jgi:hypothetical protein
MMSDREIMQRYTLENEIDVRENTTSFQDVRHVHHEVNVDTLGAWC